MLLDRGQRLAPAPVLNAWHRIAEVWSVFEFRSVCAVLPLALALIGTAGPPAAARAVETVYAIEAVVLGLTSGAHHFGFASDALTGLDARDLPEPPHAPSDYLALSLRMLLPTAPLPNRWRDEVRSADDFLDLIEMWELHLESDQIGATCTFAVTPPASPSGALRLRVIGVGDSGGFVVPADGVFTLVIQAPDTVIWLELTAVPEAAVNATWGAVHRLYAD